MINTKKIHLTDIIWFAGVAVMIGVVVIPIYTMFKYSISDISSINTGGRPIPLWPYHPTFEVFDYLMKTKDFVNAAYTSLRVSFVTVILSLVLGVPTAYVLARKSIPGLSVLLIGVLAIRYAPDISSVVPLAEFFVRVNLFNSWLSAVFSHTLLSVPYVIFMTMPVFSTIPLELEQQAYILGAGKFYTFTKIILPLAIPGVAAAAIYTFFLSWDEFIFAYFLLNFGGDITLPVYLKKILSGMPQQNMLAAMSVILSIPVIIFTFFVQKYVVQGMTLGAVK
jgi:ABC-type glycerol-3-phosphate transport system permease component